MHSGHENHGMHDVSSGMEDHARDTHSEFKWGSNDNMRVEKESTGNNRLSEIKIIDFWLFLIETSILFAIIFILRVATFGSELNLLYFAKTTTGYFSDARK